VQVPVFVTDWFAPSVLTVWPATVFTSRPDWTLPDLRHGRPYLSRLRMNWSLV
jgi:hypothetical protein